MIEIVAAVRAMALIGADPALRQKARVKAGAVTPSVDVKGGLKGYRQVPALQEEPSHAKIPMAKTVDYLLFTSHGVVLKAPASRAPFAVSLSAAAHGDLSARRPPSLGAAVLERCPAREQRGRGNHRGLHC